MMRYCESEMDEIPDKQPLKNQGVKRSPCDKLKDKESKRQRKEDIPVQPPPCPSLPAAESSCFLALKSIMRNKILESKQETSSSSDVTAIVNASKNIRPVSEQEPAVVNLSTSKAANQGGINDVSSETLANQKLPNPSPLVNGKTIIPDLNEIAPPEEFGKEDLLNVSWVTSESLENTIKLIRKLESDTLVTEEFRKKFLSWYGLRATEKECRVVSTFIQFFCDEPHILAGQLIDSFSDMIFGRK